MSTPEELMKVKYTVLANEVKEFVNEYGAIMESSGVYKGVQILYSDLIYQPKFLLIGINPGAGYSKHNNGQKVSDFDPLEYLRYLGGGFKLADETEKLFRLADAYPLLEEKTVKTNCCFFSTINETKLKVLLDKIMHSGRPEIYREIEAWTKRIVDMVKPKIIICEGKSAFGKVAVHIEKGENVWGDGYGYYKSENNIHILGYERLYSNIINKEKIAAKIKELLEVTRKE